MRKLAGWTSEHPILAALGAGFAFRLVSAWTSYGWFAPDDLGLAIEQGYAWLSAPDVPMADSIRSPILSWLFWCLMSGAQALHVVDRADVLRLCYGCLGLYSLLAIPAAYHLAQLRLGRAAAAWAAWLVALYALMPHISTRGLIEVIAIVPLLWGLVAVERAGLASAPTDALRWGALGGVGLGAATLIRFQLGLLFVPVFVHLSTGFGSQPVAQQAPSPTLQAWAPRLGRAWRATWPRLTGVGLGGFMMGLVQLWMDMHMDRGLFGTLRAYMHFNVHYSQGLGTSPWYTYLGEFALLLLPPAGLWLVPALVKSARKHALVAMCLVFFVAVHSAIGHKEDRFMFTVLPLFLVLVADALRAVYMHHPRGRRVVGCFGAINAVALVLATASDAHRNVTDPLLGMARAPVAQKVVALGFTVPALPRYYMGEQTSLRHVPDAQTLARTLAESPDWRPDALLLRHLPDAETQAALQALPGLRCEPAQAFAGDFVDRLLVRVNRHNRLRAPTALLTCRAIDAAAHTGSAQHSAI